jgi:pyruvate/2-oxoglutarate dehydrogenase complex dihydrolipoamide dehydrogenase (E3) component
MFHGASILPDDEFNRALAENVHPSDWRNPVPKGRYNLVVIGAGTAGLVTAAGAAGLGAKVALIERSLMGGDCLNTGCVPSKGLISAARAAAAVHNAHKFGIRVPAGGTVNFAATMQRMRQLRARISVNDSAQRFQKLGVDVFFGDGRFTGSDTIQVGETTLKFKRAVIATGARAVAPPIPGLDSASYLTSETLFSLTELPRRLAVIGAGPIGCEMAQAFVRFGAQVLLIEGESGILPREDRDAAEILHSSLMRDGVQLLNRSTNLRIHSDHGIRISLESCGKQYDEAVDQILVSVGRTPNIESLNLSAVGVDSHRRGITVNDYMQTTNPKIYAAGDVCSPYQFTHAADFTARLVIQNALFRGRRKSSSLVIPWCTYTSPEIAHAGLYEHQAKERNIAVDCYIQQFHDNDRAILEGDDEGFVKVLTQKGTDRILGATIAASNAGDLISEISLAMTHGLGLSKIGSTIHPYPTQAEAIRKLGDQYNRTRLTPFVRSLFQKWLAWTR